MIKITFLTSLCMVTFFTTIAATANEVNSHYQQSIAFTFKPVPYDKQRQEPTSNLSTNQLEQQIFEIINNERKQFNAPPVVLNEKLNNLARNYAERLIKENFFAHIDPQGRNPEQRAAAVGLPGVYENLAMQSRGYGQGDEQLLVNANNLMMNEAPDQLNHRYNILLPKHVCVGIGIARSSDKLMVVEEFTDDMPE